jgi:cupin 2 domain-containing protein
MPAGAVARAPALALALARGPSHCPACCRSARLFVVLLNNLFASIPDAAAGEVTTALLTRSGVRFERIVSQGQASPEGFWYDQAEREFVLLVQGRAELEFADARVVALGPGDWLEIGAHVRHRVRSTALDGPTIWLVAFY